MTEGAPAGYAARCRPDQGRNQGMGSDAFRYDGKRALVVGGATGIGAATAQVLQDLGADVIVMDYADISLKGVQAIRSTSATRPASTQPSIRLRVPYTH